jgi:hypothetical protein
MRRLVLSGMFVGGLALVAPVGAVASPASPASNEGPEPVLTPVAVQVPAPFAGVRDEAAMVLVGTALIGLAAAVRRAG